jgi:peptide/nickel transport system substrate-binding protein
MRRARKRSSRRGNAALSAFSAAACLAALLAACGPVTNAVPGGAPVRAGSGNTVTYALRPGGQASYIWPYISADNGGAFTVYNVNDFQYLMYRPLYWFGRGTSPYLNPELSLAKPPTYNGNEVKIQLKPNYKWSNGDPVVARDVVFFMNMMLAEAHTASASYNCGAPPKFLPCKFWAATTGNGLPGDISDVRVASKYVVTMRINTSNFSHAWFTDNELSQITPMPLTWDQTASGPGHCATSISACDAVYNYLNSKAHDVASYGSSPLWRVVDGPWRVKSLDPSSGKLTLTFNDSYSGPVSKNHITTLVEIPSTTEQAEYNVLQDPTAAQTIDLGYLPTVDAPVPAAGALVGPNPRSLPNYTLSAVYPWELSYAAYNFNNITGQGAIFKQQYFRDAFQRLVDQEGVINGPLHGYGKPNFGPVGGYPVTTYLSPALAKTGDTWTLNIPKAKSELANHGWQEHANGPDTCQHPGSGPAQCGTGVRAGIPLTFTLAYAAGVDWMESAARELVSNAALAGIQIKLQPDTFSNVVGEVFTPSDKNYRTWQLAQWGSWTYSPDYLPTGDTLFDPTSPNDAGGYNDPVNNSLIADTLRASTPKQFLDAMWTWQEKLAPKLPVVWEPNYPTLLETINGLSIGPQNSALTITPEMWYYRK